MPLNIPPEVRRKVALTLAALVVAVLSFTHTFGHLVDKSPARRIDAAGERLLDEAMARAAAAYLAARTINAAVSFLQDVDVQATPAGVGVGMSFGELLDPVNDVVERFSWVMLVCTAALGAHRALMAVAAWVGFDVLLGAAALLFIPGIWGAGRFPAVISRFSSLAARLAVLAVVVRFCLPLAAVVSGHAYDLFLKDRYEAAGASMDALSRELSAEEVIRKGPPEQAPRPGMLGRLRDTWERAAEGLDLRERIDRIADKATGYARTVTDLIVVFILQTLLFPLLTLWALWRLCMWDVRR